MTRLNPKILDYLSKEFNLTKNSVRQYISNKRIEHRGITLNAAAQLFATERGKSVRRFLDKEDKNSLPGYKTEKPEKIKIKHIRTNKKKVVNFFKYETSHPFKKGHIDEVNKAYTHGCYTCVFILCRKIIENLIVDILESKFPDERNLYWDSPQSRYLDFSVVLKNLFDQRSEFNPSNVKVIERLNQLAQPFKKNSNDKTHSWFHLVKRKKEIDDIGVDEIINLIKFLEKE